MMQNRLAGSGPATPGSGGAMGPAPHMEGTLGAAPQAAPSMPQNMFGAAGGPPGAPQGAPQGQAPQQPPSRETMIDVLHRTGLINSFLKQLLGKPDLSSKDVINTVGSIVADQVMGPFEAAKYLADLPAGGEPLQVRQWVAQHYANSAQNFQTVAEMLHAHGEMSRAMAQPQPMAPAGPPMAQNQLAGA